MSTIDTVDGWSVEEGDFIVIMGEECQVRSLVSDEHSDYTVFDVYSFETELVTEVKIYIGKQYPIWGE